MVPDKPAVPELGQSGVAASPSPVSVSAPECIAAVDPRSDMEIAD